MGELEAVRAILQEGTSSWMESAEGSIQQKLTIQKMDKLIENPTAFLSKSNIYTWRLIKTAILAH